MTKYEASGISSGYGKRPVIDNISVSVESGEVVGVLGPNGSGKTTLFKTLLRFLPLSGGSLRIDGEDAGAMSSSEFAKRVCYIPQNHSPVFPYTVEEMAMMGRACHVPRFSVPTSEDTDIVEHSLEALHISDLAKRQYTELSGGQQRLALIARALSQQAKILIMDEPSSDLDYANQQLVQDTIHELRGHGYGIILSTHAPEYPFSAATKVLLMKNGCAVSSGKPEDALTPETLTNAFGVQMDVVSVRDSGGHERRMCIPVGGRSL